jgi:hypothetical protein
VRDSVFLGGGSGRKSNVLLEGFRAMTVRPCDKDGMGVKTFGS